VSFVPSVDDESFTVIAEPTTRPLAMDASSTGEQQKVLVCPKSVSKVKLVVVASPEGSVSVVDSDVHKAWTASPPK